MTPRALLLMAAVLASNAEAAITITLRPDGSTANSGDAYLRAAAPTSNFGPSGALVIAGSAATRSGVPKGEFASVLKFDLALVVSTLDATFGAGQWVLDAVALELTSAFAMNTTFNTNTAGGVSVQWLATDSWIEGNGTTGVTWNSLPGLISGGTQSMGAFSYNGADTGTTAYALSSSAGFLSDLQSGSITSLLLTATDSSMSMTVNARNNGTEANRPALIITASPEPARILLLALGFTSVMLRRKRVTTSSSACASPIPASPGFSSCVRRLAFCRCPSSGRENPAHPPAAPHVRDCASGRRAGKSGSSCP